jgi:probable DNA repair protein
LRGGSGILRDFSDCPFKAYARYRLRARPLPEVHPGLDAAARGEVVHNALHHLWRELGSSAALSAVDLTPPVRRAVAAALNQKATRSAALAPRFRVLEQERLEQLLLAWLDVERQRGRFEVAALEDAKTVKLGPLELQVRLDRIDRLPDGREVMLDYKTGKCSPADWEGLRPDQPQLPIYATTHGGELAAIAFAQLAPGKLEFQGHARQPGILPGVSCPSDWTDMVEEWREVLIGLATGYAEGQAATDPKKRDQTCRICDLHSLCRIRERDPETAIERSPREHDDD